LFFSARRFASLPFKMSFLTPDDEFELYEIISATADYMDLLSGTSKLP
jgi:hypothetical protein